MPRAAPIQQDFSAGEITPLIQGQVQTDRYKKGLGLCRNWITTLQGALVRRPGTTYLAEVKNSAKKARLVNFDLNQNSGLMLEFGENYIRFYYQESVILSGGVPYEVVTTYLESELPFLQFARNALSLYIVHPAHPPAALAFVSLVGGVLTATLADLDLTDGPYLTPQFLNPYTYAPSITLTLSAVSGTGIDLTSTGAVFAATDVGRKIRIEPGVTHAGIYVVTSFVSTTHVKVTSLYPADGVGPNIEWLLGFWFTGNYPSCITLHENRMVLSGTPSDPFRVDFSYTGDFPLFAPTGGPGRANPGVWDQTIADTNAISVTMVSNSLDSVLWLRSGQKGVLVGGASGEFLIDGGSAGVPIAPTSIAARRQSSHGSAAIAPISIGRATIFVQRAFRKLRELVYFFAVDGFEAEDLTLEAEHITTSGIKEMIFQREPYPIIWCVLNDGRLIGGTYQRTTQGMQIAWHQHVLGGHVGSGSDHAVVENIACVPTSTAAPGGTGTQDELWLVVRRTINGATKRYVEYMQPPFQLANYVLPNLAYFVDAGLSRADGFSITATGVANPLTVTLNSVSGLANGDTVTIDGVYGTTQINGQLFQILNISGLVVRIGDLNGNAIDGSQYNVFASGPPGSPAGLLFKRVATISGLTHLEGEAVAMLGDGAPQTGTVASGAVPVSPSAGFLSVGLPQTSSAQLLRFEAGAGDGTATGKTRRTNRTGLMVYQAGNVKVSIDGLRAEPLVPRPATAVAALGQPLSSGVFSIVPANDYNYDNFITITADTPLPATILAVMPMIETQDRS